MEMNEFAKKIQKAMLEILGDGYDVKIQEVQKNNGVLLKGLIILTEEKNISPTIYLKPFWEAYEGGVTLTEIVRKILEIYREDTPKDSVDMSFFKEFSKVKDRICYRLINVRQNLSLLERIPHIPFLDLAICFYYAYEGEALANGTITIYDTHVDMWQTSTVELMRLAKDNTPRLFPWECNSMESIIRKMMQNAPDQFENEGIDEEEEAEQFLNDMPMYIVCNSKKLHGAACIIYPGVLEELGEKFNSDFFIIPSSVHEVILLLDNGRENPRDLKNTIAEVNRTQVEPEEVLSDTLYYYDRHKKKVIILR